MNRAWAYVISGKLSDSELDQLLKAGKTFVEHWTAHEKKLTASFEIFNKRIILVKVNEEATGASGCSIDKLIRFVKVSESMFGVELLNRQLVAYKNGDNIEVVHSSKIKELIDNHTLAENTLIYNTAIAIEDDIKNWEQPLKNSWLNKYLTNV
jgi:hypothetical protein